MNPAGEPELICSLIVTARCNFQCRYCYVTNHNMADMPLETAKDAVRDAFARLGESDSLEIDLLGGEPLMAFDTIRRLAEWVWSRQWRNPYIFFATTNGSLLDGEKKRWFADNRERFVLCLSYDGAFGGQLANRGDIRPDVEYFLRTWPRQTVQMTVSETSVPDLARNVLDIVRRGGKCYVNCAYGQPRWREERFREYEHQLGILAEFFSRRPETEPVNVLAKPLPEIAALAQRTDGPSRRACGAGKTYYVVAPDGTKYPCQMLSPLALEDRRLVESAQWDFWNRTDYTVPGCEHCPFTRSCPVCYGTAYVHTGDPFRREYNHCRFFQSELKASIKYQAACLADKTSFSSGDIQTARAAAALRKLLEGAAGNRAEI